MPIRGMIFDLDGTLVDSGLDFDAMRAEMGVLPGHTVFETIAAMPPDEAARCRAILDAHERAGAERATVIPGVPRFLESLASRGIRCAGLTRNSRVVAGLTLERVGLGHHLDPLVAREDAPMKPHPAGVLHICRAWGMAPSDVVMIGDYHHDIDAGRAAGAWSVLFLNGRSVTELDWASRAHHAFHSFADVEPLLAWLATREGEPR